MTEKNTINVKVTVDSDELREWAGRHADAGQHGVAHVLFQAAKDAESISEQAIREVQEEAKAELTRELSERLGFGDGRTEPAADVDDIVRIWGEIEEEAREHRECPRHCELCGERLATELCEHCHGSGVDAAACEASGAYAECEWCAGAQYVHPGCAEKSYDDLAEELTETRQALATQQIDYLNGIIHLLDGALDMGLANKIITPIQEDGFKLVIRNLKNFRNSKLPDQDGDQE
ncbi:hypothetical protein [Nesterenkonia flava]|uniref:Uncharacterized protein n=1 Tax=Nesterenkonia flava TaxID=469799 RepID=A0ABU1FSX1_9MICC|nr:hypothetical protein [Nesterenkonia flava]MDR5711422.1 hypothetical protein [Nesterenkonia flava]